MCFDPNSLCVRRRARVRLDVCDERFHAKNIIARASDYGRRAKIAAALSRPLLRHISSTIFGGEGGNLVSKFAPTAPTPRGIHIMHTHARAYVLQKDNVTIFQNKSVLFHWTEWVHRRSSKQLKGNVILVLRPVHKKKKKCSHKDGGKRPDKFVTKIVATSFECDHSMRSSVCFIAKFENCT